MQVFFFRKCCENFLSPRRNNEKRLTLLLKLWLTIPNFTKYLSAPLAVFK